MLSPIGPPDVPSGFATLSHPPSRKCWRDPLSELVCIVPCTRLHGEVAGSEGQPQVRPRKAFAMLADVHFRPDVIILEGKSRDFFCIPRVWLPGFAGTTEDLIGTGMVVGL
jgi:hypothetical protein